MHNSSSILEDEVKRMGYLCYNNEGWCALLLSPSSEPSYVRDINYQNTLKYF